jgi:RNA polymerase sigma factor (sigma-70 family)
MTERGRLGPDAIAYFEKYLDPGWITRAHSLVRHQSSGRLSHEDAEDIIQEAFASAYKAREKLRDGDEVGAYAWKSIKNMSMRRSGNAAQHVHVSADELERVAHPAPDPGTAHALAAANHQTREAIAGLLLQLDPIDFVVFLEIYGPLLEGRDRERTGKEVAARLGVSEATISRAKTRISNLFRANRDQFARPGVRKAR